MRREHHALVVSLTVIITVALGPSVSASSRSLGVGPYVVVTSSGVTERGDIREIGDVRQLGPTLQRSPRSSRALSKGKVIAIVVAAGVFGFMYVCSKPGRC